MLKLNRETNALENDHGEIIAWVQLEDGECIPIFENNQEEAGAAEAKEDSKKKRKKK